MPEHRGRLATLVVALLALFLVVDLAVQEAGSRRIAPMTDLSAVRTEAVIEFAGGLTGTAESVPTTTLTPTLRPTPATPTAATGTTTPACLGLHFVRDVTIPDNTAMKPAQVFTKTWQVQNSGTCPWKPGFQVVLIGGIAMGGSPFKVSQTVGPGGAIQVSIKMAAPTNVKGVVQGTWKMADIGGEPFGDYFSVVIVVGDATPSPTSARSTSTP